MKVLLATLSYAPAIISAVRNHQPDALWLIASEQSREKIPEILAGLKTEDLPEPTLHTTVTAHDDLRRIYEDALKALTEIKRLEPNAAVYIELTGGTVPMSLGVWEASKHYPDALVTWTDNAATKRVHILSLR